MENRRNNTNEKYDDINIPSLIELARENLDKDLKLSEYFVNIVLAHELDKPKKISALAIKDFIVAKYKNEQMLTRIYRIFLESWKDLNAENCSAFVRVFYRAGNYHFDTMRIYLSAHCFSNAKKVVDMNLSPKVRECEDTIIKKISEIKNEMSNMLVKSKEIFEENASKLEEITKNFSQILNVKIDENRLYYIVSGAWLENFVTFTNNKNKNYNVDLVWSSCTAGDQDVTLTGSYPGPINNFSLLRFSDIWYDPIEKNTNLPMKKNLKENIDYMILNKETYETLKATFGCDYEIPRKPVNFNDEVILEVYYYQFKVMILTEVLRTEYKEFITVKDIFISRIATVKDLKEKAIRCLNYHLKQNQKVGSDTHDIQLIFPEVSQKKECIVPIMCGYGLGGLEKYSLEGQIIEENALRIHNCKVPQNGLLIIEIKEKKSPDWFIELQQKDHNCHKCRKSILSQVPCSSCEKNTYCSVECRDSDFSHRNYHMLSDSFTKDKFDLKTLSSLKINDILESDSRQGLTGLKNLGNTCFMNSAIQCLSHTEDLTKYFLLKCYEKEINTKSNHGTNGQMAKAYAELMNELWDGTNTYLSPWDFRQIFIRFAKQFSGFSQHDSHEMLTFVLDGLHEDLNRVKSKPYLELKEKLPEETEEQSARRWWETHLKRENSIIVDFFHGQYKSTITCPECQLISLTYDPFMHLGVPIPTGETSATLNMIYFLKGTVKGKQIEVALTEHSSIYDVKKKIEEKETRKMNLVALLVRNDFKFSKVLLDSDQILKRMKKRKFEVIYYEIDSDNIDLLETFIFISPSIAVKKSSYLFFSQTQYKEIFYPRPFFFDKNATVNDLYVEIFKYLCVFFKDKRFYSNQKDFKIFYEQNNIYYSKDAVDLHFINNIEKKGGWFTFDDKCEYCGKRCETCEFKYDSSLKLTEITKKLKTERELQIQCVIKYDNIDDINSTVTGLIALEGSPNKTRKNGIKEKVINESTVLTLSDCLELFRQEERLEKDNSWYCPNCKKHQEAFKKLEIYKSPNILIIQLKRFKIKESNSYFSSSYQNKKNDCFIDYKEEFDLGPFICSNENVECKYELFAISQHYGNLSSGHYTALCKNRGKWYSFDDESVSKADDKDVINKAAYLLFYKKK